jgi:hypothetical protein
MSKVSKYLKTLEIGRLQPNDVNPDIKEENKVGPKDLFLLLSIQLNFF